MSWRTKKQYLHLWQLLGKLFATGQDQTLEAHELRQRMQELRQFMTPEERQEVDQKEAEQWL